MVSCGLLHALPSLRLAGLACFGALAILDVVGALRARVAVHLPTDVVVDQWALGGSGGSNLACPFGHAVWTTVDRLSNNKIMLAISMA